MGQHVADRRFGFDQLQREEPTSLDTILNKTDKILSSIPAQYVTLDCYSEYFGIYQASTQGNSPYALVCMHEAEDTSLIDSYDVWVERYLESSVLKYTGISLEQFFMLTRDRAEAIIQRCDRLAETEDNAVGNALNAAGLKDKPR